VNKLWIYFDDDYVVITAKKLIKQVVLLDEQQRQSTMPARAPHPTPHCAAQYQRVERNAHAYIATCSSPRGQTSRSGAKKLNTLNHKTVDSILRSTVL
jgi:hypothetical protein